MKTNVMRILLFSGGLLASVAAADVVETLDARCVEGTVTAVDQASVTLKTAKEQTKVPIRDVSRIDWDEVSKETVTPATVHVLTVFGDTLAGRSLRLNKDEVMLETDLAGKVKLPLRTIQAILQPQGMGYEELLRRCKEQEYGPGEKDLLVIRKSDGSFQSVSGVLVAVDDAKIIFEYRDKERTISRETVPAIFLAELPGRKPVSPTGRLDGLDGSRLTFTSVSFDGKAITAETSALGKVTVKRPMVQAMVYHSDRLVDLADLTPAKAQEFGQFNQTFTHRRNRSAGGGKLILAGRNYRTGLGLHSFSELTYDISGLYSVFVATVGIDDSVRPAGNATLTILADGKTLLKPTTLTGKDKPLPLRLEIKGVKQLTIRVDFGEDKLSVSDHVDIVDARLVK